MRAILLAAGMGTRLRPLTFETPKSLVKVNGTPMLERQIEFLKEREIDDIIVVTGYLNEKFEYLKEKYGVNIVHNDKYDVYNNIYTMFLVKEYLPGSYVIDADVYLYNNFLDNNIQESSYFSAYKNDFKDEWMLEFDDNNKVFNINVCDGDGYILSGVSFWSERDGEFIVEKLKEIISQGDFDNLYWDDIVKNNMGELNVYIKKVDSDDCFEIDSLEDLKKVEMCISNLQNKKRA